MRWVEHDLDRLLADAFRRASWRVRRPRSGGVPQPDLIVERGGKTYVVEIKRSSEGRRDRLIPLLSQAILEAQAYVREFPETAIPVAVVGAEHVPPSVVDWVREFGGRVAPRVAVGVIDANGMRAFSGHGLELLNAGPSPKRQRAGRHIGDRPLPHLFSDLNQWMLKVLLAERIPDDLLSAPRVPFRNPTELARAADVSVMSASRFARQLQNHGFVERGDGRLRLVRIPELLSRWAASPQQVHDFPVRWLVKRDRAAVSALLRSYSADRASIVGSRERERPPRVCLGLFAAADALGFGFVHGVPPYVYMERYDERLLHRFGLSAEDAAHSPDAYIRVPANVEFVFRPAVVRNGVPTADIMQVWLDASVHPSRGKAQADEIARRVLGPLLRKS